MHRTISQHLWRSIPAAWVLLGLLAAMAHVHADLGAGHEAHAGAGATIELATSSSDGEAPQASSDDAHHEHSSTKTTAAEICLGCRSRQDVEHALHGARPAFALAPHHACDFAWRPPHRPDARGRAYAARAPPATRA